MASVINQIKLGDIKYAIAHSAYAECAARGDSQAKSVSFCTGGDKSNNEFTFIQGISIQVKFKETNTAENPTLGVNGANFKAIYYNGKNIEPGFLLADHIYTFVYDGVNNWHVVGAQPVVAQIITWGDTD